MDVPIIINNPSNAAAGLFTDRSIIVEKRTKKRTADVAESSGEPVAFMARDDILLVAPPRHPAREKREKREQEAES